MSDQPDVLIPSKRFRRFRKKPVVIQASQWFTHGDHPNVRAFVGVDSAVGRCGACGKTLEQHGHIDTLEGSDHTVCPGDWIIRGVKGEFYPIKPDIFTATYEPAEDQPDVAGPAPVLQWQPIATAPKDGTVLLLGDFRGEDAQAYVGRFGLKGGAYLSARWLSIPGRFERRPTHWMPLPDPPTEVKS